MMSKISYIVVVIITAVRIHNISYTKQEQNMDELDLDTQ